MVKRLLTEATMTNRNQPVSQQGIALMMTLGVLSLVLILAMSFSFTARSSRQLSQNNAEVVRARLLANSGLNRVIAAIGNRFEDYGTTPELVLPGTSGVWFAQNPASLYGDRYFWYSGGTTDYAGIESALAANLNIGPRGFLPLATTAEHIALGTRPSWQQVFSPIELDSTALDRLIGRIAFLVVDESAKIDPNGVMTLNWEPTWMDSAFRSPYPAPAAGEFHDLNQDGNWNKFDSWNPNLFKEDYASFPRPGFSPQEIRLDLGAAAFWQTTPTVGNVANGRKTEWFGWRHISAETSFSANTWTQVQANEVIRRYFPYSYDIEAFVYDLDSDPATSLEDAHRFDLWDYDWDGTDWTDPANLQALYNDANLAPFWTGAPGSDINTTTESLAAPALGGFTDAATTTRTLVNLADFLDSDNAATFQPPGSYWAATVVGNEEQPYVNEVGFITSYIKEDPDGVADNGDETGSFVLEVFLEVANLYPDAKDATNNPIPRDFTGTIRLDFTLNGVQPPLAQREINVSGTATANDYTVVTGQWSKTLTAADATDTVSFLISDCRVVLLDNWSPDAGQLADYAHVLDSNVSVTLNGTGLGVETRYASVQVEDPRCNTLPTDWTKHDFNGDLNNIAMTFTFNAGPPPSVTVDGELNDRVSPANTPADPSNPPTAGSGYDAETVGDPVLGLSTAYIANHPDITFWELGAVHRGHPWQTINLKNYTTNTNRSYTDGDAILLEQIKLGGFREMRGRVNANCRDAVVWQRVLDGLQVGCTYPDRITNDGSPVTAITVAERDNLAAAIVGSGTTMHSRGQIAEITSLSDGSLVGQTTDRTQEEIIGKIANLLAVRQNLFTVLVAAQTVLDTETNNPGGSRSVEYSPGRYCLIQAEHKLLATVYRDAFNNTFRVVNIETLED
jgi:hypothetical protein